MDAAQQKIAHLVENNYLYASVLFEFGIVFFKCPDKTLQEVCDEMKVNLDTVVRQFESSNQKDIIDRARLHGYPLHLVVEYLKHAHHLFVKKKLPYMARLVQALRPSDFDTPQVIEDLQFIFPIFVEDFIHHIYEEEDNLFSYILALAQVRKGAVPPSKLFFKLEAFSLQDWALEHDHADDEMKGVREITNHYSLQHSKSIHLSVIYAELKAFEEELMRHAEIENQILFPKAIVLEQEVIGLIQDKVRYN